MGAKPAGDRIALADPNDPAGVAFVPDDVDAGTLYTLKV
jgi:hypothetical protein